MDIIKQIEDLIAERQSESTENSYVAQLFAGGNNKITRKVTEEATEVLLAAITEGKENLVSESADLIFHLLVLLSFNKVEFTEVLAELEGRLGVSGLDEKAARTAKEKSK